MRCHPCADAAPRREQEPQLRDREVDREAQRAEAKVGYIHTVTYGYIRLHTVTYGYIPLNTEYARLQRAEAKVSREVNGSIRLHTLC